MLRIDEARSLDEVRELILEYAEALGVDLSFQHFDEELERLESFYELILTAHWDVELAGCIALRRIDETTCEMKRLYVRPPFRKYGVGRALAEALIENARERGYRAMRLDTLPTMGAAMNLYESLGFEDIAPYRHNPIEGSRFLELLLCRR